MKPADVVDVRGTRVYARAYVRTRFQVNYSIIAVDILLFVAVVDRRPAAESGSALDPFRAANSRDVARAFTRRLPIPVAVATVIFANPRIRYLLRSIRTTYSCAAVYLLKCSIFKKLQHGTSLLNFPFSRFQIR